jgi:hypothetical protein
VLSFNLRVRFLYYSPTFGESLFDTDEGQSIAAAVPIKGSMGRCPE